MKFQIENLYLSPDLRYGFGRIQGVAGDKSLGPGGNKLTLSSTYGDVVMCYFPYCAATENNEISITPQLPRNQTLARVQAELRLNMPGILL